MDHEESFLENYRRRVEEQYVDHPTGCGGSFGELLCHELHHGGNLEGGLHFSALATKWGIPVSVLGELIWDHCKRLEPQLQVNHDFSLG